MSSTVHGPAEEAKRDRDEPRRFHPYSSSSGSPAPDDEREGQRQQQQQETGLSFPVLFFRARAFGPVEKERGDLALLACCLATGLVDAAAFSNWGVFVGMQTGEVFFSFQVFSSSGKNEEEGGMELDLTPLCPFLHPHAFARHHREREGER